MDAFAVAACLDDVWEGELVGTRVGNVPVLLVSTGGRVHAYLDRCPHLGVRLSEGELAGAVLTCRAHHWQYDLASGTGVNPCNVELTRLPVRIEDGRILVDVGGVKP